MLAHMELVREEFQFQSGAINSLHVEGLLVNLIEFQFQSGAINSEGD